MRRILPRTSGSLPSSSLPTSSSAEPALTGEWRYTLPPNPVVSTPRVAEPLPGAPLPVGFAPALAATNPPVVPGDLGVVAPGDVGDLFHGPTNGTTIVPAYLELSFPSANLQSRIFARQFYEHLSIGQSICVLGFNSDDVSWATTVGPLLVIYYLVVHKLLDGSIDATRAYTANEDLAASHPAWITFLPEVEEDVYLQKSVIILNESAIRMGFFSAQSEGRCRGTSGYVDWSGSCSSNSCSSVCPHSATIAL